ncbi:transcriptional regulator [Dapis sp. BLCC M126]|uniref:transcriptional regulator n=1 Tax=Dapis sp. BLCC M126 TaxID=3400189 RepID=UPI003CF4286F
MTPTKLSDSEKIEIVELYQTTEENTITLADRYGVSSSTIRRLLQSSIPEDEYKNLVQQKQKRPSRSPKNIDYDTHDLDESADRESLDREGADYREVEADGVKRRRRRSSSSNDDENEQLIEFPKLSLPPQDNQKSNDTFEASYEPAEEIEEILAEDLREQPQNLDDFENDDLEDFEGEFDDDDKFDVEEDVDSSYNLSIHNSSNSEVKIYTLTESVLPKTCYLVVDKFTELVTKPLIAFGELGQIPVEECQEKTLPVFDNHRVAHRFSAHNQRVLKVPDGRMLQKTTVYLQAKGITRLLIDGQVYKLS